jgi:hypothetical protein
VTLRVGIHTAEEHPLRQKNLKCPPPVRDSASQFFVSFRDYGEWVLQPGLARSKGDPYISHDYPALDMTISEFNPV